MHDDHSRFAELRVQQEVARRLDAIRSDFKSELEDRAATIRSEVTASYEQRLRDADTAVTKWRERARMTYVQWQREHDERERRRQETEAKRAVFRKPKGKQVNVVVFDLKATIAPDAEATFDAMKDRYGPAAGNSFKVTHGQAVGYELWVQITYGPVKGGEKADVRRNLARCLKDAGAELIEAPQIEVLSREVVVVPEMPVEAS